MIMTQQTSFGSAGATVASLAQEHQECPRIERLERHPLNADRPDLVGLIGETATLALAEKLGGTRLYVPARIKERHRLVPIVGIDAARALCGAFGATVIRVPLSRDLRAMHYRAQGCSVALIALRLGLTESGVRGLFKRLEKQREGQLERKN